jgi:hypothetical protein
VAVAVAVAVALAVYVTVTVALDKFKTQALGSPLLNHKCLLLDTI